MMNGRRQRSRLPVLALVTLVGACTAPADGCGCAGFTSLPQGSFDGEKQNTAGAVHFTDRGFGLLNDNATSILDFFAPGSDLVVPVPCSIEQLTVSGFSLLQLAIADTGTIYCTDESCGRLDGVCDARDLGQTVTIHISSLDFTSAAPDRLDARITATVQTGQLPLSTVSRNSPLCLLSGGGPLKCTVDLDSTRSGESYNELTLGITLAVDPRWDELLTLEVAEVGGAKACGGGAPAAPGCIEADDIVIANEGGCGACTAANFSVVKTLLIDQLSKSLKAQVTDALAEANCARCDAATACPTSPSATATCDVGAGACIDTGTGRCVPAMLGMEGRLDLTAAMGTSQASPIDFAIAAGGSAEATSGGISVGLRGGFKAEAESTCVRPATPPTPPVLPLPNFDQYALGPYAVGVSLSQPWLEAGLYHAYTSGALCLEAGPETVAALESDLLSAVTPSLKKLTAGDDVPLRLVLRPARPPTVRIGAGGTAGVPSEALLRLSWKDLELDLYAWLEDRPARLFTLVVDVDLPLDLEVDGCAGVTPVLGSLSNAITVTEVKNAELLAEPLDALRSLVPSLLSLAEPQVAGAFEKLTLPAVQGFELQLLAARGIERQSSSTAFNHLALYADAAPAGTGCTPNLRSKPAETVRAARDGSGAASVELRPGVEVSWRVQGGFWSPWARVGDSGRLVIEHPRLRLVEPHLLELRTRDGHRLEARLPR